MDGTTAWVARVAAFLAIAVVLLRFGQTVYRIRHAVGWGIYYPATTAVGLVLMGLGVVAAMFLVRRAQTGEAKLPIVVVGAVLALFLTVVGAIFFPDGIAVYPGPVPGVPG